MQSTKEQWLPIPGYEGSYEVSDHGGVKSLDRVLDTMQGPRKWAGKMMTPTVDAAGRMVVNLRKSGKTRQWKVHRLVMLAFVGEEPEGMEVCHNDGNPHNNHVSNLRYDTHNANYMDMFKHGTHYWTNQGTCTRGHLYDGPNLVHRYRGGEIKQRDCRACHRTRSYIRRHPEYRDHFNVIADQSYKQIMGI